METSAPTTVMVAPKGDHLGDIFKTLAVLPNYIQCALIGWIDNETHRNLDLTGIKSLVKCIERNILTPEHLKALEMYLGTLVLVTKKSIPLMELLVTPKYRDFLTPEWACVVTGETSNMVSYKKCSLSLEMVRNSLEFLSQYGDINPKLMMMIISAGNFGNITEYLYEMTISFKYDLSHAMFPPIKQKTADQPAEQPAEQQPVDQPAEHQPAEQPIEQFISLFHNYPQWVSIFTDGLPKGSLNNPLILKNILVILNLFWNNKLDDSHVKASRQYFGCPLGQLTEAELHLVKMLCHNKEYLTEENMKLIIREECQSCANEDDILGLCFHFIKENQSVKGNLTGILEGFEYNTLSAYILKKFKLH
jgi:hypothetical protein